MPLREEMETQGRWLFRRRSFLPLLVLFALICVLTGMEVIGGSLVEGKLHLDAVWMVLLFGGVLFFITVRVVDKKSRFLLVQGR